MFKKRQTSGKTALEIVSKRLSRRVKMLTTPDLVQWTDSTLSFIGKNLARMQETRDPEQKKIHLEDALLDARSVVVLLEELQDRVEGPIVRTGLY